MTASLRALALSAALLGPSAASAADRPYSGPSATQLEQVDGQLRGAEENLRFVETQFTLRPEPSDEDSRTRRFSDGEIQYLLGDWAAASVLFYDLISEPRFKASPHYEDALFYLSDSLFQQKNYIGARVYLRELLSRPNISVARFKDALSRFLAVAGRLNQYDGIDGYVEQARKLSGGQLTPDIAYIYARWTFKRTDLPDAERISRTREAFTPLAEAPGPFRAQAVYHLGVASVQAGDIANAIGWFQQLLPAPPAAPGKQPAVAPPAPLVSTNMADADSRRIHDLALLSLGRLLYESGRYDEALDRYGQVPRDSESFPESLYEIAWTHVRKGDFQKAKDATDILLLVAPDSQLAPEAQILQGTLLQKLHKYSQALETYDGVVSTYAPVRDQMDALLRVNHDPVSYFDNLLARGDRLMDVNALLPPLALKYASTQKEVAGALRMVSDIDSGRKGAGEAQAIADRILSALDSRGLETFPELQEGYTRADAVETALTHAEQSLVQLESSLVEGRLTGDELQRLAAARAEREALRVRFASLPTTQKELEERRRRMQSRVDEVDREAFRLGYELQSLNAIAMAVRKWVDDTRRDRKTTPDEEREFLVQLQGEAETLSELKSDLDKTRRQLADERNSVDTSLAGEATIRTRYAEALVHEHDLLLAGEGRLPEDSARAILRAHEIRNRANALRVRVTAAKEVLHAQLQRRGREIRDKVLAEQALLQQYEAEVTTVSGDARNLVGRIAYDSFRRVRQQFYDLVLKADVGVVDVAFNRKQDNTTRIQDVSQQKDEALRALDSEFKGVLSEGGQ
ncbi:tetratricopeptide repeat protein [Myxococcaceae bacterium JPH2]|nr:tetratricopeptide repeat protein [Myxococcaceae bacterium JPH2]